VSFVDPSGLHGAPVNSLSNPIGFMQWSQFMTDVADAIGRGVDDLQDWLDYAGFVPAVGTPADVTNATISAARGNPVRAAASIAGIVGLDLLKGAAKEAKMMEVWLLEKVVKPDAAADALANRIGGVSRVRFAFDASKREFDAVSEKFIAQTKPALGRIGSNFRDQAKATFEMAKTTGRSVYYHIEGTPAQGLLDKLAEYSRRYGVDLTVDTKPLK
jgi:hypothetical protein